MWRHILAIFMLASTVTGEGFYDPPFPPLTRETLNGSWEGLIGIGTHPVVFHVVIAARDSDSYLSEIYPDSMSGRLFHLESCSVADGKVSLHFVESGDYGYWIEGEGYGEGDVAWINARIGLPSRPEPGPGSFYLAKGNWVQQLGPAAARAAEKIPKE